MLARTLVKKMSAPQKKNVQAGAMVVGVTSWAVAYHNYRQKIKKDFLRSEAHYRFQS